MPRFGDFAPLCRNTPSYPWCNLFYKRLLRESPTVLVGASADPTTAPVGINPVCGIPKAGNGNLGNLPNMIVCGLSILVVGWLVLLTSKRKAAVGRVELRSFLILYLISLPLQLLSTGSVLQQGSTGLVVVTALHAGIVAALFWALLANALVATQIVEDGTLSSLAPFYGLSVVFFGVVLFIGLDVALGITSAFKPAGAPESLNSIPLFVFTSIWPAFAAVAYLVIMIYIVLVVLNEFKPMWLYIATAVVFIISQLAYFLLSKVICKAGKGVADGSVIATFFETVAVVIMYHAWRRITEDSWDHDDDYYPS